MALKRPAWTIVFVLCWLLCIVGTILTHIALGTVIPELKGLPDRLEKGFGQVFKFDYLLADSAEVKAASLKAIQDSGYTLSQCQNMQRRQGDTAQIDTSNEKKRIQKAFANSLNTINVIAHDKYLGTAPLQKQAANMDKIIAELNKIGTSTSKRQAGIAYCNIEKSANLIVNGVGDVKKEINKFKDSDAIKEFTENSSDLDYLHILPYIMVLSLVFFSIFWLRGGVCPCCKGGTWLGCLFLLPHGLLWLVFFIISAVIVVAGIGVKYGLDKVNVDALNGKPNAKDVVNHIQTKFPEFWDKVFKDMVEGLDQWWIASIVFVVFCVLIAFYACCTCCIRPYQKLEDSAKADPAKADPAPAAEAPAPAPAPEVEESTV